MEVVAGPQQTPPRVSLISSAELVPVNENDLKWQGGFVADLDGVGEASTTPICDAPDLDITSSGGVASYKPYALYATNRSSTFGDGLSTAEFYDKAQRKLQGGEAAALEAILWDGYAGAANQNPFLSDGAGDYASAAGNDAGCTDSAAATTTITSNAGTVVDAFAVLEQQIGESSGSRGMIHLRPIALHALVAADVVRREGNVWLSPMDNIVVPGRGYPGTGPAGQAVGATEWMYGHSGIVQIRRGGIIRLGENDLSSQYHRGWNDHEAIVQRVAHVLLDPTVPVYAIDFESLGSYAAGPSVVYGGLDVVASTTDDVNTSALYGWNLVNGGGAAGDVTINITPGEEFVVNLAAGESVTYFFPSPIGVTNVEYTADADITGTLFISAV